MDIEKMGPIFAGGMTAMIGLAAIAGLTQAYTPAPPEPTGFKCPYCTLYFDTLGEMSSHIKEEHPDKPPFEEVDIDWGAGS